MLKRIGESTAYCGKPQLLLNQSENVFSFLIRYILSLRKLLISSIRYGGILYMISLYISPLCQTLSNADLISKKIEGSFFLF